MPVCRVCGPELFRGWSTWIAVMAAALGGCGTVETDDPMTVEPLTCDPEGRYGPPTPVPGLNTPASDRAITLSPDELTAYLASTRGGNFDLYIATRASIDAPFSEPVPIAGLNTPAIERDPSLSGDGLTLVFDRVSSATSHDLFIATRSSTSVAFGAPKRLDAIDTELADFAPWLDSRGAQLYWASGPETQYDIMYAWGTTPGSFAGHMPVAELNTPEVESHPILTPELRTIYFNRRENGQASIWTARRKASSLPFEAPTRIEELATLVNDFPMWVSSDTCRLYLTSNVSGEYDIMVSERR
jgi:hypothetical protein